MRAEAAATALEPRYPGACCAVPVAARFPVSRCLREGAAAAVVEFVCEQPASLGLRHHRSQFCFHIDDQPADHLSLVAAGLGVLGLIAFLLLVVVPAVTAYRRVLERVAAFVLSLYVLAALVGVGVLVGALVVLEWPRLF